MFDGFDRCIKRLPGIDEMAEQVSGLFSVING